MKILKQKRKFNVCRIHTKNKYFLFIAGLNSDDNTKNNI